MKKRVLLKKEDNWDLSSLYSSWNGWGKELKKIFSRNSFPFFPNFSEKKHHFKSPKDIKNILNLFFSYQRKIEKLSTYARLKLDEDLSSSLHKTKMDLIETLVVSFQRETAWIEPKILSIDELSKWKENPILENFRFYLEKLIRMKKHTLSFKEEEILALSFPLQQTATRAFQTIQCVDLKFPKIKDKTGKEHFLSLGSYGKFLHSSDRELRKNCFFALHKTYLNFGNTFSELLRAEAQKNLFITKVRNFSSCLEASLFTHNIDPLVYQNLILTVRKNISVLHRYIHFKKKALSLEKFHFYDLYAPFNFEKLPKIDFEKAKEFVLSSVSILGKDYQNSLKEGFGEKRWVDPFETLNKKSGAYSGGCYDSYPYILMNSQETVQDFITLAHEAGHSMHSFLSRKTQPYQYSEYSIFVAEVASTFNEHLAYDFLFKQAKSTKEQIALLSLQVDSMQATFFRQVLFADFELTIHSLLEKNEPISFEKLKAIYHDLYKIYYGKEFTLDEELFVEWARIPHFYYNFYVYQYATGIASATALFKKIQKDLKKVEEYLHFLSSGGSDYPLSLLKKTGVDLMKKEPILAFLDFFSSQLNTLENLWEMEKKK